MKRKSERMLIGALLAVALLLTGALPLSGTAESAGKALEKVKVTIATGRQDIYSPWSEMTVIQAMEEAAKDYIEIEWLDWPGASSNEKKSLAINSGNYPDALVGTWLLNTTEVANYSGQGILVPLEEYINETVMPNLNATLNARPEWRDELTTNDGHIYGLPSYNEATAKLRTINDTVLINTQWLKAVGMEMPGTTEELYQVLKAFKAAGDLNGNGIDDEIPMSFFYGPLAYGNHMYGMHSLIGWFGVCSNKQGISLKDGQPVYVGVQPELKEAVKYFHTLYADGLLDQEVFTQSDSTYAAKIKSNPAQIGVLVYWSSYTPNLSAGEGVYEYLAPLTSPTGAPPSVQYRSFPMSDNMAVWVTDKGADKIEQILTFMDAFYDQRTSIECALGLIGTYLEEVSAGVYRNMVNAEGKAFSEEEKSKDVPLKSSPFLILKESFAWAETTPGDQAGLEAMAVYGPYIEPAYTYINQWLTGEESQELGILSTDIGDHYKQHLAKWIVSGGVDKEWDSYVQAYEGLGLARLMEIMTVD